MKGAFQEPPTKKVGEGSASPSRRLVWRYHAARQGQSAAGEGHDACKPQPALRSPGLGLLYPDHPARDAGLEFGALDGERSFRHFVQRKEAAFLGALLEACQVEFRKRAGAEARRDRSFAIFHDRVPDAARPLEDDGDGAPADRHQAGHAGCCAEGAALDVGGQKAHLGLGSLRPAVEADAGLQVAAKCGGIGDVEGDQPVLDLRGGRHVRECHRTDAGVAG